VTKSRIFERPLNRGKSSFPSNKRRRKNDKFDVAFSERQQIPQDIERKEIVVGQYYDIHFSVYK
jgi:hypothetical protein